MQAHSHSHEPADHHANRGTGDRTRVLLAMGLTATFMVVEVVGGLIAGSLALIADAAHMLTDTASLALAWIAFRLSDRSADAQRTFGFERFQVLAAFVNGLALFAIVVWIAWEAIGRLMHPTPVMGAPMALIAAAGLVVNIAAFAILHGGSRENLNLRGAALHVLGDLLGSVGALVAAGVVLATGWTPIDPLLSLLVAALVLRSAWYLVKQSGHILLEGAPEGVDAERVRACVCQEVSGVDDVHHVHTWSLSPERPMIDLHVDADGTVDHDTLVARIKSLLAERFAVQHTNLQVEYGEHCPDAADRP